MFTNRDKPEHWRESANYRYDYFKQNPGLLGILWWCSQCGMPLIGKSSVQVDHIFPPSKVSNKKVKKDWRGNKTTVSNTSALARAMNTSKQCVAACAKCNLKKSNKVGGVTLKGVIAKIIEVALFSSQKIIVVVLAVVIKALYHLISMLFKIITSPLRSKSSWYVKLAVIVAYVGFGYYIYNRLAG
jgi:5-methylcytosine-specific restriction endonuclease McrA